MSQKSRSKSRSLKAHPLSASSSIRAHPIESVQAHRIHIPRVTSPPGLRSQYLDSSIDTDIDTSSTMDSDIMNMTEAELDKMITSTSTNQQKWNHQEKIPSIYHSASFRRSTTTKQKTKMNSAPKNLQTNEKHAITITNAEGVMTKLRLDKYPKKKNSHSFSVTTTFWKDEDGKAYIGKTMLPKDKPSLEDTPIYEALTTTILHQLAPEFNAMKYMGATYDFPIPGSTEMCTIFYTFEGKSVNINDFIFSKDSLRHLLVFFVKYLDFSEKYGFSHLDLHINNVVQNENGELGIIDFGRLDFKNLPIHIKKNIPSLIKHFNQVFAYHQWHEDDDPFAGNRYSLDMDNCLTLKKKLGRGIYGFLDMCTFALNIYRDVSFHKDTKDFMRRNGKLLIIVDKDNNKYFAPNMMFPRKFPYELETLLKILHPFLEFVAYHLHRTGNIYHQDPAYGILLDHMGIFPGGFQFQEHAVWLWCNHDYNGDKYYKDIVCKTIKELKKLR